MVLVHRCEQRDDPIGLVGRRLTGAAREVRDGIGLGLLQRRNDHHVETDRGAGRVRPVLGHAQRPAFGGHAARDALRELERRCLGRRDERRRGEQGCEDQACTGVAAAERTCFLCASSAITDT
jgi:hypothetical protein